MPTVTATPDLGEFWNINTPPTPQEIAELCDATRPSPDMHMIARRMAFQIDHLQHLLLHAAQYIEDPVEAEEDSELMSRIRKATST